MEEQNKETVVVRVCENWCFGNVLWKYFLRISLDFLDFGRYYEIIVPLVGKREIQKRNTPNMIMTELRRRLWGRQLLENIRFTEYTSPESEVPRPRNYDVLQKISIPKTELLGILRNSVMEGENLEIVDISRDPWKTVQVIYTLLQYSS